MLMYQAVARYIAQLVANHWTGDSLSAFVELMMGTFNTDLQSLKLIVRFYFFPQFCFLVDPEVVHTSYLKKVQCSTDKDCWVFILM